MRPRIVCHMGTSIDGKLHPSRFSEMPADVSMRALHAHYEKTAEIFEADGWIVGRVTMAEMAKGEPRDVKASGAVSREARAGDRRDRALAIAFDPSGRVHYGKDEVGGDHAVAILGTAVSDDYLAELAEDGVSYVFAGEDGRDIEAALAALVDLFGVKTLLLEGGGGINGAFFKAKLVDEFSTLIFPAVDGLAGVQSIVDLHGEENERPGLGQALRLTHCETLDGGMVWLRHAVEAAPKT